jgi:hypothetical protein
MSHAAVIPASILSKKKGATPTKPHIVTSPSFFLPKKRQGDVLILIDWLQRIQQVNQVEGV